MPLRVIHYSVQLLVLSLLASPMLAQQTSLQQALNEYVTFLNQAVDVTTGRFQMLQSYQADVDRYRKRAMGLRLASSGPLETYYYQKALATNGLSPTDRQQLATGIQGIWQLLTAIDQTGKSLES
ncbi:hypothetical protein [Fibrella arboris]|uniref:hypothetical protein n=1 Tax=Fibrella arboris TaxID=3242486 RepID=UPI0035206103